MNSKQGGRQAMTLIWSSSQAPMQPGNTDLTRLAPGPPPNALTDLSAAKWQHNPLESEDRVLGQGALTEDILSQEEFCSRGMEFLENEDMHTTSAAAVHVEWTCWRYKSEWMCCSFRRGEFPIYAVPYFCSCWHHYQCREDPCEWESSCWVVEGSCLVCYFYLQACSSKKSKAGGE
ncbi:unnamed protein product [Sphagnum troendelagicum]|uniref:Uncharacterized protein n=1 Tax=Sphagnum troendelagicum TaxID=128251 RepID=A0ABP0TDJ6_9BRYO